MYYSNYGKTQNQIVFEMHQKWIDNYINLGMDILKTNISEQILNLWAQSTIQTLREIANENQLPDIINSFSNAVFNTNNSFFIRVSNAIQTLFSISNQLIISHYNIQQNMRELPPIWSENNNYFSQGNNAYYNSAKIVNDLVQNKPITNDELAILNIISAYDNSYTLSQMRGVSPNTLKFMSDAAIDIIYDGFIKDELKDSGFWINLGADTIKELLKYSVRQFIDNWYINNRY
ncbi:MAG: hypothetical protein LBC86_04380 [Oscillospiraceae bacterium]|jgi:uncharacterized protein (UPF0147 family)|nr:hypothetical protein [Oscillospiraceae bacterium]